MEHTMTEAITEPKGSWAVYRQVGKDIWFFHEWYHGIPIISKDNAMMIFTHEGMARKIAEKLGEGWDVIDTSREAYEKTGGLLAAIFGEEVN